MTAKRFKKLYMAAWGKTGRARIDADYQVKWIIGHSRYRESYHAHSDFESPYDNWGKELVYYINYHKVKGM